VSDTELAFDVLLAVPPARVFAAITEAGDLRRWFCDTCESEPRVNGRLLMRWAREGSSRELFEARWVQFEPPLRAGFQGGHVGYPGGNAGTVWFELAAETTGSRLCVRHELPTLQGYETLIEPWRSAWPRALARLKRHVESAADAHA
jgi:uncharacterized protein YndB with AHSA1/START domain